MGLNVETSRILGSNTEDLAQNSAKISRAFPDYSGAHFKTSEIQDLIRERKVFTFFPYCFLCPCLSFTCSGAFGNLQYSPPRPVDSFDLKLACFFGTPAPAF